MFSYAAWVKEQMAQNRPLNEFVAELLVGAGSNFKSPTANLYTASERLTPQKTAEDIAQVFLGTRIQCSQCHNHPFDRWTLDDYYGFSAFFAGVNLKRGVEGREVLVSNNNAVNTTSHPVDGRAMKPKFLGGDAPQVDGQDPRKALAAWLTAPENTAFSQTMANIIWAHFFGRGIVEPVDDVRISNPPSNKELLEETRQAAGRPWLRQEKTDPRHLQFADVSARRGDQQKICPRLCRRGIRVNRVGAPWPRYYSAT